MIHMTCTYRPSICKVHFQPKQTQINSGFFVDLLYLKKQPSKLCLDRSFDGSLLITCIYTYASQICCIYKDTFFNDLYCGDNLPSISCSNILLE